MVQLTIGRITRDKLEHARNLLGHQLPSGNLDLVLERALDALIEKLGRGKFAATPRPQRSVAGIRLRCRAHNQYEAERIFGAQFMRGKREAARERGRECATPRLRAALGDGSAEELIVPLRNLGFSAGEARRAARACREISRGSLEIRLRRALSFLRPRARVTGAAVTSVAVDA